MTKTTHYMLCTVLGVVSGYPDDVMPEYADVFQKILDNDKLLQGREWNQKQVYKNYWRKAVKGE